MSNKSSLYKRRRNIYIPVHRDTEVQELQDGTLIFFLDVRHLPEDTPGTFVKYYLEQFEKDIETD